MSEVAKVEPRAITPTTPAELLSIAVNQGADLDKLEKLMELQERYEANEARKAFSVAMAAFRAEAPSIEKNSVVDYTFNGKRTHYRHASLDYITGKINPVLGKHQLTFAWETEQVDGKITVHCDVSHVMGHKQRTTLTASPDESGGKNSVQGIGSTVSYLQRYTLTSALGLATGGQDDDAQSTSVPEEEITEKQVSVIKKLIEETNSDTEKFLSAMGGFAFVEDLPASIYNRALNALNKKKASMS